MAEFAQRGIEEMLVEVERMRKINLFSTDETRAIMKKRKRFEYKAQRRTKEKEVFMQYVQYEINLLQLIKMRREKKSIEVDKDYIERPIVLRIYKLFRILCFRFKNDIKLWLTHIEFAKKNFDRQRVSKIFTTMLQIHNKKPNLWIMAAKFEFEENESIETARNLFQRALRFLPKSQKLWVEYFRMELMCVETIMKRRDALGITDSDKPSEEAGSTEQQKTAKVEDAILSCKIAEVVYLNAIKVFEENVPELILALIEVANKFNFTKNLIEAMYEHVEKDEKLKQCERSWEILARRGLLGEEEIMKKSADSQQTPDFAVAEMEEKAHADFAKALQALPTHKMHQIYMQFCLERFKIESKFLNEERFTRLNDAFRNAREKFGLSLEYDVEWISAQLKSGKMDEALNSIERSLEDHKYSSQLWSLYLSVKIEQRNESNQKELIDMFYKAVSLVKQKESLDLWKLIVNWCLLNNYEETEKILLEGSQIMTQEISSFVRLKYLKWALQKTSGLGKVRKLYENLRQKPPYDLNFYLQYIEIEKCAPKIDETRISGAYEDALLHFHKTQIDLWLSYIEFKYSKLSQKDPEEISGIYWRAMKQLQTELVEDFSQKFCLLKINLNQDVQMKDENN